MILKALRICMREGQTYRNARRMRSQMAASSIRPGTMALIKPDLIGDFVLASSYLHDFRQCFPHAEIHLIGHPSWAELAQWLNENPIIEGKVGLFDAFIPLAQEQLTQWPEFQHAAALMAQYQTLVYFSSSRTSAMDRLLALAPGYTIASEGDHANQTARANTRHQSFYNQLIPILLDEPEYTRYARLVAGLAPDKEIGRARTPQWTLPQALAEDTFACVMARCGVEMKQDAPFIAVSPFTSTALKNWPIPKYAGLLHAFLENRPNWRVLLMGTAHERPAMAPLSSDPRIITLAGHTSLPEAVCVLARARASLSSDTAAAHIASAVGLHTLVLMGGGQYGRFYPYPNAEGPMRNWTLTHEMPCFQCNWLCRYRQFSRRPAPCVERIAVEDTLDKLLKITS